MSAAPPAPPREGAAIELRGVSKRYGSALALEPLDLEIREGEFFCLLGPSGCGKTTTLNLIGGFIGATTGAIAIRGQDVTALPPHRRPVNTVFQSYALFPHMTVAENVRFGLRMARVPRPEQGPRVDEALRLVGLEGFGERRVQDVSGGQAQRVAVARALVNRPSVLLLDEPLGALDLKLRKRLQVELGLIHRDVGTTFVFVTHDQEEAMALADRIAVMDAGRVEQIGTPEEIYRRPSSRFVADFIGESNIIEGQVEDGAFRVLGGVAAPCDVAACAASGASAIVVRPESLRVGPDGPVEAEVMSVSFLGPVTRLALRAAGSEALLIATVPSRHGHAARAADLAVGDRVRLDWDAEAAHPLGS